MKGILQSVNTNGNMAKKVEQDRMSYAWDSHQVLHSLLELSHYLCLIRSTSYCLLETIRGIHNSVPNASGSHGIAPTNKKSMRTQERRSARALSLLTCRRSISSASKQHLKYPIAHSAKAEEERKPVTRETQISAIMIYGSF